MTRVYLGFAADLRRLLDRMKPLAVEHGDEWQAAAALIPSMDVKVRDQLATEHLVRCFRLDNDVPDRTNPLPRMDADGRARPGPKPGQKPPAEALLAELGLDREAIKRWAVGAGLIPSVRPGSIKMGLIEAYVLAHQDAIPAGDAVGEPA